MSSSRRERRARCDATARSGAVSRCSCCVERQQRCARFVVCGATLICQINAASGLRLCGCAEPASRVSAATESDVGQLARRSCRGRSAASRFAPRSRSLTGRLPAPRPSRRRRSVRWIGIGIVDRDGHAPLGEVLAQRVALVACARRTGGRRGRPRRTAGRDRRSPGRPVELDVRRSRSRSAAPSRRRSSFQPSRRVELAPQHRRLQRVETRGRADQRWW